MAKKIKVDFDSRYDILYLGYVDGPESYGVDIDNRIVKFVSMKDDTPTGIEVTDYLDYFKDRKFSDDIPFSKYLNSKKVRAFAQNGLSSSCVLTG